GHSTRPATHRGRTAGSCRAWPATTKASTGTSALTNHPARRRDRKGTHQPQQATPNPQQPDPPPGPQPLTAFAQPQPPSIEPHPVTAPGTVTESSALAKADRPRKPPPSRAAGNGRPAH